MIWKMLKKRREYHLELNELVRYRVWSAISNTFMQGLVCAEMPSSPASVEEFLVEYRFESPTDEEDRGSGITPLMLSSMAGNVEVVHELTRRHRVNLNARTRVELPELMLVKGVAALHAATLCSREQTHAVVTALLAAGADPNVASTAGYCVLTVAAVLLNEVAIASLLNARAENNLDIEQKILVNSASPLNIACYQSTTNIVELLLNAGANRAYIHDNGGVPLLDGACGQTPAYGQI